ncbi:hypothetical protein BT63DRAFT_421744 [Microthyrium microscopicum]|uniref:Uncharacterized protein n=1 Tax=Microthyrium microscopicum TaxID=703497 RepID=A0A6A6URB8_9PEZI|nr:hypothetical protein BT63DRAFT_421744 [Microthyrium microscopicum]
MFSCNNYERGCRGRTNTSKGACSDCITLHLATPRSSSTSSQQSQSSNYSAMSSAFASLSNLHSKSGSPDSTASS